MIANGSSIRLNVYDMIPREAYMGFNVYVAVVGLIKGRHMQCVNKYT